MNKKTASIDTHPDGALRFLLCDTTGNFAEFPSPGEAAVSSPIRCLDKAVDGKPEIIVVRFGKISIDMRETLLDLCTTLKQNSHTQDCIVVALLRVKHRKLLDGLEKARVDYVRYVGDDTLNSKFILGIIQKLGPDDRLERHLEELCPFLHYAKIDSRREMPVCGAYLDRMVLGGRRLRQLCQTADHHHCEYYLNPRRES